MQSTGQSSGQSQQVKRLIARRAKPWMRIGLMVDLVVHSAFHNHAVRVSKHPWRWICASLLVVSLPMFFLSNLSFDYSELPLIVSPTETATIHNLKTFGVGEVLETLVTDKANMADPALRKGNVFTKQGLALLAKTDTRLWAMQAEDEGDVFDLRSFCLPQYLVRNLVLGPTGQGQSPPAASEPCLVRSVLQVWPNNSAMASDPDPLATVRKHTSAGKIFLAAVNGGTWVPLDAIAGGIKYDADGSLASVAYWRAVYEFAPIIQVDPYRDLDRTRSALCIAHHRATTETSGDLVAIGGCERAINLDSVGVAVLGVWFVLMLLYLTVAGFKRNLNGNVTVLLLGAVNAVLAIACALGILTGLGLLTQALLQIGAGVVLAIGVDDIFIITSSVARVTHANPTRRLAEGLGEAGTAILMTTLTDIIVFGYGMIGSAAEGPRNLAMFVSLALFIDFLMQMCLVTACLSIDLHLSAQGRYCLGLCCPAPVSQALTCEKRTKNVLDTHDDDATLAGDQTPEQQGFHVPSRLPTGTESTDVSAMHSKSPGTELQTVTRAGAESPSTPSKVAIQVSSPPAFKLVSPRLTSSRDSARSQGSNRTAEWIVADDALLDHDSSCLSRFFATKYVDLLLHKGCHAVVLVILLVLLGVSSYGLTDYHARIIKSRDIRTEPGEALLPHQSRFNAMFVNTTGQDGFLMVTSGVAYWDESVQTRLMGVCTMLREASAPLVANGWDNVTTCWYSDFVAHSNGSVPRTQRLFEEQLRAFVALPAYQHLRKDIMWDKSGNLFTTRFSFRAPMIQRVEEALTLDTAMRAYLAKHLTQPEASLVDLAVFYLSYAKSTRMLEDLLLETGLVGGLLVTLASAVFLINPLSSVLVTLSMWVTCLSTFTLLDIYPLRNVNLQMVFVGAFVLGFGVDYTAHVVHHFNTTAGSVEQRLRATFAAVGGSVFHGFGTAFSLAFFIPVLGGYLQMVIIIVCTALFLSFVIAVVIAPVVLQYLTPPPALRDVEMHLRLKERKKDVDSVWEAQFAREKDVER